MPRDMFGDVVDPSVKLGTKQWYTVPLSILAHFVVLFLLVVIPLLATDSLPDVPSMMAFVAAPPPPPPPPPAPTAPQPKMVDIPNPNAVPIEAPKEIKAEPPPINLGAGMGVVGGVAGGVPGGVPGGVVAGIPPPPPPQAPVRVGGNVKAPERVKYVQPVYPQIAQSARVSGIVIIEATIGKDGSVTEAHVIRSIALLDQAALDAVKQWKYTPTTLNGVPVPVIMTVTVNFTLQ